MWILLARVNGGQIEPQTTAENLQGTGQELNCVTAVWSWRQKTWGTRDKKEKKKQKGESHCHYAL